MTHEKLGYQRVVTIADSVDFASQLSDEVHRKIFADSGIEVLATETFETGDTDFSAQLTRIKALEPDAIFLSAQQIEVIRILTQGRELGIPADIPIISQILLERRTDWEYGDIPCITTIVITKGGEPSKWIREELTANPDTLISWEDYKINHIDPVFEYPHWGQVIDYILNNL